ncbi:Panacea domain-containing protein [Agrobacterium larrymoorei]|uniref:Panacea domain-containing protein n=1 Tax=Agrobacterium larrymoorei TaxID=160699 RepID=A0AAF0HA06_9HYPH|nr:Panacea domain-containing protein [Agrobacterium larrymoorei]WHA41972.1 Panacea domain-containing protein [Agrobacterium larrymoorei]
MTTVRFRFSPQKAFAALHWMVAEHPGIDLHAALKACYFADKEHLNKYLRPIFGATYRAMKFGPVPLEIYEMAKGEALWLAEMNKENMPWELRGYRLARADNQCREDRNVLSDSEKECFSLGLTQSLGMTFNDRTEATHGSDWQKANLGFMRYEDMLDEGPDKSEIIHYLEENARFMKI